MRHVLSRDQIRSFDRWSTEQGKVPSLLLMENAGRGAADFIHAHFPGRAVVVCAGTGNNGGDGFVVARRLLTLGTRVQVLTNAQPSRLSSDARCMLEAFTGLAGNLAPLDLHTLEATLEPGVLVVDALLGTGLDRDVRGDLAALIQRLNAAPNSVISLDLPSGLDANTGAVLGAAIRADVTLTFAHYKLGLLTPAGLDHCGRLEVVDIGVPPAVVEHVGHSAFALAEPDLVEWVAPRPASTHKVRSGRVAVVAGSPGKYGAALLVVRGALRAGAGLVTLVNEHSVIQKLESRVLEAMTQRLDERVPVAEALRRATVDAHVLALGPGLGVSETARSIVSAALDLPCHKVLDADALTLLARDPQQLRDRPGQVVLTPHPGEAGRLLGVSAAEVEADRYASLQRLVELTGAVVLLKGARTLVAAPGELPRVIMTGSPALATGGSGDVLTGIIAANLVHHDGLPAACLAAGSHGLCGDRWQARTGADRGLLASEIADELPHVLAQLSAGPAKMTD